LKLLTPDTVHKAIAKHAGVDLLKSDHLFFYVVDDYNELFHLSRDIHVSQAALSAFYSTFGYLTTSMDSSICLFSGTLYQGIIASASGSTYMVSGMSLGLQPKVIVDDIINSVGSLPEYQYINNLKHEVQFQRLLKSIGGHMRSIQVFIAQLQSLKGGNTDIVDYAALEQTVSSRAHTGSFNIIPPDELPYLLALVILRKKVSRESSIGKLKLVDLEQNGLAVLVGPPDSQEIIIEIPYLFLKRSCRNLSLQADPAESYLRKILDHIIPDLENGNWHAMEQLSSCYFALCVRLNWIYMSHVSNNTDRETSFWLPLAEFFKGIVTHTNLHGIEILIPFNCTPQESKHRFRGAFNASSEITKCKMYTNASGAQYADVFLITPMRCHGKEGDEIIGIQARLRDSEVATFHFQEVKDEYNKVKDSDLPVRFIFLTNAKVQAETLPNNYFLVHKDNLYDFFGVLAHRIEHLQGTLIYMFIHFIGNPFDVTELVQGSENESVRDRRIQLLTAVKGFHLKGAGEFLRHLELAKQKGTKLTFDTVYRILGQCGMKSNDMAAMNFFKCEE
jgi:hypothetical protein